MTNQMIITALDPKLSPGEAMLSFPTKRIIAAHRGSWVYLMTGTPQTEGGAHAAIKAAVYAAEKGDRWALSGDLAAILRWCERQDRAAKRKGGSK